MMKYDEILTDLHDIKDAIADRYKNDVWKLFDDIKKEENKLKKAGKEIINPPGFVDKRTSHRSPRKAN